jgi:DNA-binding NtrC family response regulator
MNGADIDALVGGGRYAEAAAALDRLSSLTTAQRILRHHLAMHLGDSPAEALRQLRLLVDDPTLRPVDKLACLEIIGRDSAGRGETSSAIKVLRQAVTLAESIGDPTRVARSQAVLAETLLHFVSTEAALPEVHRLRQVALAAGDPHSLIEFHLLAGEIETRRFRPGTSRHLDTARSLLSATPHLLQLSRLYVTETFGLRPSQPAAALASAEQALALARQSGSRMVSVPAQSHLIHVLLTLGQLERGFAMWDDMIPSISRPTVLVAVQDTLMQMALASGDRLRAAALQDEIWTLSQRLEGGHSYSGLWHVATRAKWMFGEGRAGEAARMLEGVMPHAARVGDRHMLEKLKLFRAEALALAGEPLKAVTALVAAVEDSAQLALETVAEMNRLAGVMVSGESRIAARSLFARAHRIVAHAGFVTARRDLITIIRSNLGAGDAGLEEEISTGNVLGDIRGPIADNAADARHDALQSLGAALDLAAHPTLAGHEVLRLAQHAGCATSGAVFESDSGGSVRVTSWFGCDGRGALALQSRAGTKTIELVRRDGRSYDVRLVPAADAAAHVTLLSLTRLIHATVALHEMRAREHERGALWPEQAFDQPPGMIVAAESMVDLVRITQRVAASNATVLFTGETGAGKETLAHVLHAASPRRDRPFIVFDCAGVASEGLDRHLVDEIQAAAGGTVLLDEVGELSLTLQPKLLRVLESADVRFVAATHADLDGLVASGKFREDLFYRLNVVRLQVPPLRERREEIPLLAQHFLEKFSVQSEKSRLRIAEETMEYLVLYPWPGNVRQLANEVRRLVALAEAGAILMPEHLSPDIAASRLTLPVSQRDLTTTEFVVRVDQPLAAAIEHVERAMMQYALALEEGRADDAAQRLGMSRQEFDARRRTIIG